MSATKIFACFEQAAAQSCLHPRPCVLDWVQETYQHWREHPRRDEPRERAKTSCSPISSGIVSTPRQAAGAQ